MARRPLSFAIAPNSHGWVLSFGEGQLWALFLILSLVVLTWPLLWLSTPARHANSSENAASAAAVSKATTVVLIAVALVLWLANIGATPVSLGQASISATSIFRIRMVWIVVAIAAALGLLCTRQTGAPNGAWEMVSSLLWLGLFASCATSMNNYVSMLIIVEAMSLALLLLLASTTSLTADASTRAAEALELLFWVSALSTLSLVAGIVTMALAGHPLGTTAVTASRGLHHNIGATCGSLLMAFGLSVKVGFPPFGGWLVRFYNSATPTTLVVYIAGYYPLMLVTVIAVLGFLRAGPLAAAAPILAFTSALAVLSVAALVQDAHTARTVLAASSLTSAALIQLAVWA